MVLQIKYLKKLLHTAKRSMETEEEGEKLVELLDSAPMKTYVGTTVVEILRYYFIN